MLEMHRSKQTEIFPKGLKVEKTLEVNVTRELQNKSYIKLLHPCGQGLVNLDIPSGIKITSDYTVFMRYHHWLHCTIPVKTLLTYN